MQFKQKNIFWVMGTLREPALLACCNILVDQYCLTVLNDTKMGKTEKTHGL